MYTLFYLVYCICSFFLLIPFVLCAAHQRLLAGSAHLARLLTMSTLRREAATQLWHKHGSYRVPPTGTNSVRVRHGQAARAGNRGVSVRDSARSNKQWI